MKTNLFLVLLVCASLGFLTFFSSCNNSGKNSKETDLIEDTIPKINFPKDSTQDQIGNLLSGIDISGYSQISISDSSFWNKYKLEIDSAWKKLSQERLSKMDNWSKIEISPKINDTTLLFYPFSGPDFLNAYHLFPNANDYTLIAMEKLGTIPDLKQATEKDIKAYLNSVNNGLRDIYKRSYFITGNMEQDLRKNQVNGVLPLLYVFLERTGHKIYEFGYYQLQDDGVSFLPIDKPTNSLKVAECIKFKVLKEGDTKLKEVTYFYADISDDGFVKNPILLQYLKSMRECNTFIKSASYLSHYETFTNIRNTTLEKSKAVLQDDTGVPFRYFTKNFDYFLYGTYEKPIDDFKTGAKYLFQKDLEEKYQTENPKALDFSLGYHWRSGIQNWVLYVRKVVEVKNEADSIAPKN
ncbi:MAG: hypothetical protein LBV69_00800 [Bacteroidales bacterium]|jgi:hypothetical protein|nr:hypothetical protein [Bacteroidales bacterium]